MCYLLDHAFLISERWNKKESVPGCPLSLPLPSLLIRKLHQIHFVFLLILLGYESLFYTSSLSSPQDLISIDSAFILGTSPEWIIIVYSLHWVLLINSRHSRCTNPKICLLLAPVTSCPRIADINYQIKQILDLSVPKKWDFITDLYASWDLMLYPVKEMIVVYSLYGIIHNDLCSRCYRQAVTFS